MIVVKSLHAGIIHRSFQWLDRNLFSAASMWGFTLSNGEPVLEQDMWRAIAESLPEGDVFDAGLPKSRGEFLVAGSFLSSEPVTGGTVTVELGGVSKSLAVFGDRYWSAASFDGPEAITAMPIDHAHAFGGPGYDRNPIGKGMVEATLDGVKRRPLPNIEYADALMTAARDRPRPASFGRVDVTWSPRRDRAGTYDQSYIERHMPGYPPDLDPDYFNDAPRDQWFERYPDGSESFRISRMNLERPELTGRLPGIRSRIFVERQPEQGQPVFLELDTALDTVWFLPNSDIGILVHRASCPTDTRLADDIARILLAHERQEDAPRPREHYQDQMAKRTDPESGFKYMLNTRDLLPSGVDCGIEAMMGNATAEPDAVGDNTRRYLETRIAAAEAELEGTLSEQQDFLKDMGIEETTVSALRNKAPSPNEQRAEIESLIERMIPGYSDPDVPVDLTSIDMTVMDEIDDAVQRMAAQAEAEARATLDARIEALKQDDRTRQLGMEMEAALAERQLPPVLPRIAEQMDEQLAQLGAHIEETKKELLIVQSIGVEPERIEAGLAHVRDLESQYDTAREQARAGYRDSAHFIADARSPHPGKEPERADWFLRQASQQTDLAGWDGAFADISRCRVRSRTLHRCYFEHGVIAQAEFQDVDFSESILSHADLTDTTFRGCVFTRVNLGGCNLNRAVFEDCDLSSTILARSRLEGVQFTRCRFSDAMGTFLETDFRGACFVDCELPRSTFNSLEMQGCRFENCRLEESNFLNCQVSGMSARGSTFSGCNMIGCDLSSADFNHAIQENIRFVGGCTLTGARFMHSHAVNSNFRDNDMDDTDFTGADVSFSDFGYSRMRRARLVEARARRSLFDSADLEQADLSRLDGLEASFQDARVTGTRFRAANLFSANLYGITVGDTDFKSANLKMTLLKNWRPGRE